MVNTGTWNSDLALVFMCCFFAPIVLHFFFGFMLRFMEMFEKTYVVNVYQEAPPARVNRTVIEHVSRTKPAKPAKPKTTKAIAAEDDRVLSDAVGGLVSLGYKKSDARRIASGIYVKNNYKRPEQIVRHVLDNKNQF